MIDSDALRGRVIAQAHLGPSAAICAAGGATLGAVAWLAAAA